MKRQIMEMNWTEIKQISKEKAAVLIGFAPMEEHGRHLPLGVDIYETQYWMNQTVGMLEEDFPDFTFLVMPIIPFGHAEMKGFPGNLHLTQELFYELVVATLRNVIEWEMINIIVISGHADPRHTIAIEQACETIKQESKVSVFAPMGAIFSKEIPTNRETCDIVKKMEQYASDFHAGWIETSNMLVIREDLVNSNYQDQPDIVLNGRDMINPELVGSKTDGFGHVGFPKEATRELGIALNESVCQKIRTCTAAYLKREDYEPFEHHALYHVPTLRVTKEES